MSHTLTLELSDATYAALEQRAGGQGTSISGYLREHLERLYGSAVPSSVRALPAALPASFGSVRLGQPDGSDNESIDADLALAYANELPGT